MNLLLEKPTQTWKGLSVQQPWSWLIASGLKPVENRSWTTMYRGPLLIHAPKRIDKDGYEFAEEMGISVPQNLPTGRFVGAANLVDIVHETSRKPITKSDWFFGPYGWLFEDATPLINQIEFKGRLGLFDIPDEIVMASFGFSGRRINTEGSKNQ